MTLDLFFPLLYLQSLVFGRGKWETKHCLHCIKGCIASACNNIVLGILCASLYLLDPVMSFEFALWNPGRLPVTPLQSKFKIIIYNDFINSLCQCPNKTGNL